MIVLVALIVLLRRLLVPTVFRMVHPYITVHSVELFLHLFHVFFVKLARKCSYAHAQTLALRLVITYVLNSVEMYYRTLVYEVF